VDDTNQLDNVRLLELIERIGKGRFAQALAPSVSEDVARITFVKHWSIFDAVT
jgi:hypothetical protein